jgi:hypothetical protein
MQPGLLRGFAREQEALAFDDLFAKITDQLVSQLRAHLLL